MIHKHKSASPTSTILVLIVALNILYIINTAEWIIHTSIILGIIALLSEKAINFIHIAWMGLAKILSYIVPNIILTLVFFLILLPLSLLSKLFRGNNLLKLKQDTNSLWTKNERVISREYFEKSW